MPGLVEVIPCNGVIAIARERKFTTDDLFRETGHVLLELGYEGFTISAIAERLQVSRSALYKYYDNKDELISDFMIHEMNRFLDELREIEREPDFESRFRFLLELIFRRRMIHELIDSVRLIPKSANPKVRANLERLDRLHLDMYACLGSFVALGRREGKLRSHLPDGLVLGFIFQSIMIPNHEGIPHDQWVAAVGDILRSGIMN
jgi:AcrR family transcriptional regulator